MPGPKPTSSATVLIDGTPLDEKYMQQLLDVKVRDNLLLPDTAIVRLRDPKGEHIDSNPLKVGAKIEVRLGQLDQDTEAPLFKGDIVALEPEFTEGDCVISARAYDRAYKLNAARRSKTFQNQKAEDIVRAVASAAKLTPGTIDSTPAVHEYFQQSMETDWELCWRLARMNDFEFLVEDDKFHFRKRKRAGAAATLTWGDNLLTFKPRMSGLGQAKAVTVANHDPKARQALTAQAGSPELKGQSKAVQERQQIVGKLGGDEVVVADRVITTNDEAQKLAQATLDRLASTFVEADGKAHGSPKLRAGATVKIDKVGDFSGEYVLSQTTHVIGAGGQYTTAFIISGRSGHTFSELLSNGAGKPDWGGSLVIGEVTNNNDPEGMGRVRVKFPALGSTMEGWWARVATLNAGDKRGVFMLPQVGDEVVVGFEHGDTRRPFVLGSLYHGKAKLPAELHDTQGRKAAFGVLSDAHVHVESQKAMTLRSHEKMLVEVKGSPGSYTLDAAGNVEVTAGQSVTVKGSGSVTVESSGSLTLKGATIDIQASGPVNVKGAMINLG